MVNRTYADFAWEQAAALLAIDSPSGYTAKAAAWVKDAFSALGFDARITRKGGVLIDLGGADAEDALLLEAHADTLGGMVSRIKGDGRLVVTPLGGMRAENAEAENVRVHTRCGKVIAVEYKDETRGYHWCAPGGFKTEYDTAPFETAIDHILVRGEEEGFVRRFERFSPDYYLPLSDHSPAFVDVEI